MENLKEKQHEFGYIQDQKVFLKGFLEYPDRQIGVVKESEETNGENKEGEGKI